MKKILFILPTLTAGGAERIISFIAQNINSDKYASKLLITGLKKDAVYVIDNIEVKFLEKERVLKAVPNIFWCLINERPDIVVSSIGHLNAVMGLLSPFFINTKFVIREASVISTISKIHKEATKKDSFNIHNTLSKISFKLVDKIICQSIDMAEDFINLYNVKRNNIVIINNPLTQTSTLKKLENKTQGIKQFITIGRLSKEKGQLRIINLLAKLEYPFHYTIIGDGPYKNKVLEAVKSNNLVNKCTYINYTQNVLEYLKKSDMFLQGSYVEGFPNTVLESCSVGTPVLAFNVPGGTKEIIQHEINGYLVENEDEYLYYLNNIKDFKPQVVRDSVIKKFDKNTILKQYESLFENL